MTTVVVVPLATLRRVVRMALALGAIAGAGLASLGWVLWILL
jgi:hypothetical protein